MVAQFVKAHFHVTQFQQSSSCKSKVPAQVEVPLPFSWKLKSKPTANCMSSARAGQGLYPASSNASTCKPKAVSAKSPPKSGSCAGSGAEVHLDWHNVAKDVRSEACFVQPAVAYLVAAAASWCRVGSNFGCWVKCLSSFVLRGTIDQRVVSNKIFT